MNKLSRKSKLLIIIIAAVLALSGGTAAVILTVAFPRMLVPELYDEVYPTGEPTYTVTFLWEKIDKAYGYKVEYKYDLYPGKVFTATLKANSATVDRMKGKLYWRVKTLGKTERQDSGFSDWKSYEVAPIPLGEPSRVSYETHVDGDGNIYYRIIPETWVSAKYTYFNQIKTVDFYEVAIAPPGISEELAKQDTRFVTPQKFKEETHQFASGVWTVYYRAINTKGDYGEFGSLPGEPAELFELFGPGNWVSVTITVP